MNNRNNYDVGSLKNYPGGKNGSGTYQSIINLIPSHDIYIEGYFGSGAILKKKRLSKYSICLDLNEKCLDAGRQLNLSGCIFIKQDTISFLKSFLIVATFLRGYGCEPFIYLDPPYPFDVRRSNKKIYKYEFSTLDHIALLDVIRSSHIPIMISSYNNELYNDMLSGWNIETFQSMTRKGLSEETLYMNYSKPLILHDYRYLGNNFREREKNRGIICRNVSKYKRMMPALRNSLIEELLKEFK